MEPEIIYEDEHTIALNKPAGLVVHSDGRTDEPTLVGWLISEYPSLKGVGGDIELDSGAREPRAGVIHRLDRDTSGIIIVAKTEEAFAFYKDQFLNHTVQKTYHGLVWGTLKDDVGSIDSEIGRSKGDFRKRTTGPAARGTLRPALTRYRVLGRAKGYMYMEFYPMTGRTHQIRVHMNSIGHPILGDSLYGKKDGSAFGLSRLALHAFSLKFVLFSGKETVIKAPYPPDFEAVVAAFKALC